MRRVACAVAVAALSTVGAAIGQQSQVVVVPPEQFGETVSVRNVAAATGGTGLMPLTGTDLQALAYYDDTALQLSMTPDAYGEWTLGSVATYLGYPGLQFWQTPCALMKHEGVLSARYFAPKTSSVTAAGRASEVGWRQIIRLKAREGSEASAAGIAAAFVLFNFQQLAADIAKDPFAKAPEYTQVMLVRLKHTDDWPAYWLLFDRTGVRALSILATFHGGDVSTQGNTFYVPGACAQCHGRDKKHPHLNFFDVDHWHDRSSRGDDFALVRKSPAEVVATGSCDLKPMQVFEMLNREVARFNAQPMARTAEFVRAAVDSWVEKHPGPSKLLRPIDRAYGVALWHGRADAKTLSLLNRYCYRCHGTTKFDVFDKDAVLHRRLKMIALIKDGTMPQDRQGDRQLSKSEKETLIKLLQDLK
jgi:hypothetical protein